MADNRPEDWTIRATPPGIDIEMRGGHAEGREYLVLALQAAPGLSLEQAAGALSPWMLMAPSLMTPWQPWPAQAWPAQAWMEFWRLAWSPWLALAAPRRDPQP
jgi:hypothetical protein